MGQVGLIEGFFGPAWSWESRHHLCESVSKHGGDFYIYAPKKDPYLRKLWTEDHPAEMWQELKKLSQKCQQLRISFGIGLSPFELHESWNSTSKNRLKEKIQKLAELEFAQLGLFFDDMRGSPDLAEKQCEIVEFTRTVLKSVGGPSSTSLLFCPTYYSLDSILDKVFGARPPQYLETIGNGIHQDVQIFWTGSKVIPAMITAEELQSVSEILRRKPFLWENYFANDGPKQCKFIKLKPFAGRSREAFNASSGWAINPMNQARLSEVVFLSALNVLQKGIEPSKAHEAALREVAGAETSAFIQAKSTVLSSSLDVMDDAIRTTLQSKLERLRADGEFSKRNTSSAGSVALDIYDWLDRIYDVDSECLTD